MKPFIIMAITAKINSELKKYDESLKISTDNVNTVVDTVTNKIKDRINKKQEDDDMAEFEKDVQRQIDEGTDDQTGSGLDISLKENIISDAEAVKIFNKTVDMSKIQDGEGLRLAGAPSYKGRGALHTNVKTIINMIKTDPTILHDADFINRHMKQLGNSQKAILMSFISKYK
jgi:hypothetical protein